MEMDDKIRARLVETIHKLTSADEIEAGYATDFIMRQFALTPRSLDFGTGEPEPLPPRWNAGRWP